MTYTTLVVLAGVGLLGSCSGLVGSFAVLRQRALIGDALAHAALPGVCLAFLIVGQRSLPALLFGGFVTGVLGTLCVSALRHGTRIKADAAIGLVLSVFYGAGVALLGIATQQTETGNKAGLDSYYLGRTSGMLLEDVVLIGGAALGCLLLTLALYKELKLITFDPDFARVQGWPAFRLDLVLMTMIAVTVIIGLPAVGVVLMAALLIIPAAAARFWTERLGVMLALSSVFGLAIGVGGTLITTEYDVPSGPVIVLTGTAVFLVSLLVAPRRGLVSHAIAEYRFRRTLQR